MNHIYYKEKQTNKTREFSRNAFAKLNALNDILKNPFHSVELKETIFNTFTKAQKCYYAFSRLVYIYKIKKHKYVVTDDLMTNKLDHAYNFSNSARIIADTSLEELMLADANLYNFSQMSLVLISVKKILRMSSSIDSDTSIEDTLIFSKIAVINNI